MAAVTFGKRLRAARERAKKTQADIAKLFGIEREAVALWESDKAFPTADKLARLASALSISIDELLSGTKRASNNRALGGTVSPGPDIRGAAPLISWVRAGQFSEAVDNMRPGEAEAWYPLPRRAGQNTYCLRVEGDSMTAPHGKSYPAGCIIFVDPDQRSPANGQRVIAKLEGSPDVTFKQFVQESGRTFLRPLNPQYPPIFDPFKVIGTIIGKWEEE